VGQTSEITNDVNRSEACIYKDRAMQRCYRKEGRERYCSLCDRLAMILDYGSWLYLSDRTIALYLCKPARR